MRHLAYLGHLLAFAFARNPLLYASLALSLLSVAIELAAMSVLFPLSSLALSRPGSESLSTSGGGWAIRFLEWIGAEPSLRTIGLLFLSVLLVRVVTLLASQSLILLLGKRLHAQLSSLAFESIVTTTPIRSIDEKSVGYFITLAGDESFRASNLIIAVSQFAGVAALGVLYFASIVYYSPAAALAVAAFLALSFFAMLGSFRESHRLGALQIEQSQLAGSIFLDAINGLRAVRAMSAETYVVGRYRSEIFRYAKTLFRVDLIGVLARLAPVSVLLGLSIVLLWNWDGGSGRYDPAFAFVLLMYLMRFFPVVGQGLNLFMRVLADSRAGRDVLAATAVPARADEKRAPVVGPVTSISVRSVDFRYAQDKPVLRGLNMEFRSGRSYAILGPSGSGKSTLLDLILGFHDVLAGDILINGRNVQTIELSSLRGRVVLLGQQSAIFNDSIRNNILFGADLDEDRISYACDVARLADMLKDLPRGIDTVLAYQGGNLSGGQKQRIGLARALARRPDVLIFDESTNALDRETRVAIVAAILREYADKLVIFITHDHEIASMTSETFDLTGMKTDA